MKTTLNKIRDHSPCTDGWKRLLKYLNKIEADDQELKIKTILKSNGLDDALWCLRTVDGYNKEIKLFAIFCARQVQHLMKDKRSIKSLEIAEDYINGKATREELVAAVDDAYDAVDAATYYATYAAYAYCAASTAYYATYAAYAYCAASTPYYAGDAVYYAANAAADAADAANYDADCAYEEMRKIQTKELMRICRAKK